MNAKTCTPSVILLRPRVIAITAPTAAPPETPTVAGSASGLRKTPCITTPATASEAPTTIARATRGSRTFQKTAWLTEFASDVAAGP